MVQDMRIYVEYISATCAKHVRKDYLSCICVQMLHILRYLLVRGVKGAEFASFAVQFWSFLD